MAKGSLHVKGAPGWPGAGANDSACSVMYHRTVVYLSHQHSSTPQPSGPRRAMMHKSELLNMAARAYWLDRACTQQGWTEHRGVSMKPPRRASIASKSRQSSLPAGAATYKHSLVLQASAPVVRAQPPALLLAGPCARCTAHSQHCHVSASFVTHSMGWQLPHRPCRFLWHIAMCRLVVLQSPCNWQRQLVAVLPALPCAMCRCACWQLL
jgi:hypothetical protein